MKSIFLSITVIILLTSCFSKKEVTTDEKSSNDTVTEMKPTVAVQTLSIEQEYEEDLANETIVEVPIDDQEIDIAIKVPERIIKLPVDTVAFDHSAFDTILNKYVTKDGIVNYKGIKKDSKGLKSYIKMLNENPPQESWTKNARLAYYMNAYNAMTIDLIIRNYPLNSIKDIKKPWEQRYWQIDNKWINLDEIEHQILRKMNEPRIHFGINCASFSCPPLMNKAFTSKKVEQQLEQLAKQFINDPKRNTITANNVEISNIFKWFKSDFTKNGDLIDFLNNYSNDKINDNARVRYMDYNWELNE